MIEGLKDALNAELGPLGISVDAIYNLAKGPPKADYRVIDTTETTFMEVDVPGIKNPKVDIDGDLIIVTGTKRVDTRGGTLLFGEPVDTDLELKVKFPPERYDLKKVVAETKDGVLTVALVKKEPDRPDEPISVSVEQR
jgi:HSP20 family molecular chaperone IbpA